MRSHRIKFSSCFFEARPVTVLGNLWHLIGQGTELSLLRLLTKIVLDISFNEMRNGTGRLILGKMTSILISQPKKAVVSTASLPNTQPAEKVSA